MPKYYKIWEPVGDVLFVTMDESGAVIIRDRAGRKVFLSRFQARLMKQGINGVLKSLFDDADSSKIHIEEIEKIED